MIYFDWLCMIKVGVQSPSPLNSYDYDSPTTHFPKDCWAIKDDSLSHVQSFSGGFLVNPMLSMLKFEINLHFWKQPRSSYIVGR